jgi:hypothetical protein
MFVVRFAAIFPSLRCLLPFHSIPSLKAGQFQTLRSGSELSQLHLTSVCYATLKPEKNRVCTQREREEARVVTMYLLSTDRREKGLERDQ